MISKIIDDMRYELIKTTQEVIKINSVVHYNENGKKFGEGPDKALNKVLNIAEAMGFKTVNLDGLVGYAEYGDGDDYIAVLGHLDVVPEGDGWIYPPYGGEIHDGKIYGRGTLDDKGPMVAALYGLKAIKDANIKLSKRIRIIFGIDEENGSDLDIEHYNKCEKQPVAGFTPDAEFPIIFAEKGLLTFELNSSIKHPYLRNIKVLSIKGGNKANMVPDYCETIIEYANLERILNIVDEVKRKTKIEIHARKNDANHIIIKAYGISAHGSMPEKGMNAIMGICKVLHALGGDSELANYISLLSENIGLDTTGKGMNIALEDKESGKLSYNLGIIDFNGKYITSTSNIRYPVTFSDQDVLKNIKSIVQEKCIKLDVVGHQEPLYLDKESDLIKTLQRVYTEETGNEAELIAIGGGTYAKCMDNIVAFGPIFPGKPDLDHQANEYIEVDDLVSCAKIYGKAMMELAK